MGGQRASEDAAIAADVTPAYGTTTTSAQLAYRCGAIDVKLVDRGEEALVFAARQKCFSVRARARRKVSL